MADDVIEARRRAAEDFYRGQNYSPDQIARETRGIDYRYPVEVVALVPGRRFRSYQGRRTWQGNYYFEGAETPSRLGIGPLAEDKVTGEVLTKVVFEYEVARPVQVLRSTSGEIVDDWLAPSIPYPATGGATQFFVPDKAALRILD